MGAIERPKGSTAPEGRNESEGGFVMAIIVECFTTGRKEQGDSIQERFDRVDD